MGRANAGEGIMTGYRARCANFPSKVEIVIAAERFVWKAKHCTNWLGMGADIAR